MTYNVAFIFIGIPLAVVISDYILLGMIPLLVLAAWLLIAGMVQLWSDALR